MTDYATLRTLAEQATPGPWEVRDDGDVATWDGTYVAVDHEGLLPAVRDERDAAYIVAADPQTILALLDEREKAWELVDLWTDTANEARRRVAALEEGLRQALPYLENEYPDADVTRDARALLDKEAGS